MPSLPANLDFQTLASLDEDALEQLLKTGTPVTAADVVVYPHARCRWKHFGGVLYTGWRIALGFGGTHDIQEGMASVRSRTLNEPWVDTALKLAPELEPVR